MSPSRAAKPLPDDTVLPVEPVVSLPGSGAAKADVADVSLLEAPNSAARLLVLLVRAEIDDIAASGKAPSAALDAPPARTRRGNRQEMWLTQEDGHGGCRSMSSSSQSRKARIGDLDDLDDRMLCDIGFRDGRVTADSMRRAAERGMEIDCF